MADNNYQSYACSEKMMRELVERSGFSNYETMIATLSSKGISVSAIAEMVGASRRPFIAYHAVWISSRIKPLHLGEQL